jgi:hypothetical protein
MLPFALNKCNRKSSAWGAATCNTDELALKLKRIYS